jgi:DNA polymerase-3 subunit gamma/tau
MRDAQSLLDQVLAGAEGAVDDAAMLDTLGLADRAVIAALADAVIDRDPARVLTPLDDAYQRGVDLRRFTRDLLEHFRNLAVAKVSDGALLPDVADDEATALREQAQRIPPPTAIAPSTSARGRRGGGADAVSEAGAGDGAAQAGGLPPLLPVDDLLQRLSDLEARLRGGTGRDRGRAHRAATRGRPAARADGARRGSGRRGSGVAARRPHPPWQRAAPSAGGWQDSSPSLTPSGRRSPTISGSARCVSLREGATLAVPRGFRFDYLSRRDHLSLIEELAGRFFGRRCACRWKSARPATATRRRGAARQHSRADQRRDAESGGQAAVQILGGEVAEVRERRPRRREGE